MFMMCHRIGLPPISTMGLGRKAVSSDRRVPNPPAKMTAFIGSLLPGYGSHNAPFIHLASSTLAASTHSPLDMLTVPCGHSLHDRINLLRGDMRIERQRYQTPP